MALIKPLVKFTPVSSSCPTASCPADVSDPRVDVSHSSGSGAATLAHTFYSKINYNVTTVALPMSHPMTLTASASQIILDSGSYTVA